MARECGYSTSLQWANSCCVYVLLYFWNPKCSFAVKRRHKRISILNYISLIPWKISWRRTQVIENLCSGFYLLYFVRGASEKDFFLSAVCQEKFITRDFKYTTNCRKFFFLEDSTYIFKRNNVYCYFNRLSV